MERRAVRRSSCEEQSLTFGLRYLAPAGAPIRLPDLARWTSVALSKPDPTGELREVFRARFGIRHAEFTSTGRAGLTLLLKAMRRLAPAHRDEVVLPTYTCYSVAASVVKAGLRLRIVDVSEDTLDFAPAALAGTDFSRVLAIIATNLYGLPNDMLALTTLAHRCGAFLIDDAAQAMGASIRGRCSGTWGDAGLFSFDKGKNVSAIDGGVVVTSSDDIARALRQEMTQLEAPGKKTTGVHIVKALAYFTLLRPWLYAIPTRIPQLALGTTVYTTDFPLQLSDRSLLALGLVMMGRLDAFTSARQTNAAALLDRLASVGVVSTITPRPGSTAVYLRLPVLFQNQGARDSAIRELTAVGIGATGSYPGSIADVPELRDKFAEPSPAAAAGRSVAKRILTLPTHPFVTPADITRMVDTLRKGTNITCAA